jgi:DNA-binding beta-propeller fold protein YncE
MAAWPPAAHASVDAALVNPLGGYLRTIGGPGRAPMYPSGLDAGKTAIYVADTGNDQVVKYAFDGTQMWRRGTRGDRAPGRFGNPRDIAYRGGRVYVADTAYNRVQVLDARTGAPLDVWEYRFGSLIGISAGETPGGTPIILGAEDDRNEITIFTTGGRLLRRIRAEVGSGRGQLNAPRDAATDSAGNIYVADYANNRIVKYSPRGAWITSWGTRGSEPGQFIRPYGVDVDRRDRIYVADSDNNRIQKFTAGGRYLRTFGSFGATRGKFTQLRRVAVGGGTRPRVFGADLWGWKIVRFRSDRRFDFMYGGTAPEPGRFNEPSGIAVDARSLFVTDAVNQRVQRFDAATGRYETQWGKRGWGNKDRDGFNWPRGVAIEPISNTVWVADTKNNRLVQFQRDGTVTGAKLGIVSHTDVGLMSWPYGVAAAGGDVIVADTRANRVARWDTATKRATWTATSACGSAFTSPYDVDVRGDVAYVADAKNRRIVKLNANTGACIDSFGASVLHFPQGVTVAGGGDVWATDTTHNVIAHFSAGGGLLGTFGGRGRERGRFNRPTHIETAGGRLYIADTWNDRIQVFDLKGRGK